MGVTLPSTTLSGTNGESSKFRLTLFGMPDGLIAEGLGVEGGLSELPR
jgi:hypothetical protein